MAHASSIPLRPAVIEPERRRWVYEKHWPAWADPYSMEFKMGTGRNWLQTRVRIFFAGCVAEHRYLGRSVDDERAADCGQVVHALVGFGGVSAPMMRGYSGFTSKPKTSWRTAFGGRSRSRLRTI